MVNFCGLKAHGIDPAFVSITLDGEPVKHVLRFDQGFVDFYVPCETGALTEEGGYQTRRRYGDVEARVLRGARRWPHSIPEPAAGVDALDLFRVLSYV